MKTNWEKIPGFNSVYKINNLGIIKSLDRYIYQTDGRGTYRRLIKGKEISIKTDNEGYLSCHLGRNKTRVHTLLAKVFIPNPENKPQVNHKNGNKLDNSLENLEWVTHKENCNHAWSIGLCEKTRNSIKKRSSLIGHLNSSAKLTKEDVIKIRNCYRDGNKTMKDFSIEYNVDPSTISYLIRRRTYSNVK